MSKTRSEASRASLTSEVTSWILAGPVSRTPSSWIVLDSRMGSIALANSGSSNSVTSNPLKVNLAAVAKPVLPPPMMVTD